MSSPEPGTRPDEDARVQKEPAQTRIVSELAVPIYRPTQAEQYAGRVREMWVTAGNDPPGPDSGDSRAWHLVSEAVASNISLIGAALADPISQADAGLPGDVRTVQLLVSAATEQLTTETAPLFISGTLASTVDRLQQDIGRTEDITRERLTDIVVQGLEPLRGNLRVVPLIPPLLGYLDADRRPRRIGIYQSVGLVAQLMTGLDDRQSRLTRLFMYHYALMGVWRLLQDPAVAFDNTTRQVLSVAAGNAGNNLWVILPERVLGAGGSDVVKTLRTILAATVRDLPVPENRAAEILAALGLEHSEPRAALTVLDELGTLAGPWTEDAADMARIESASAVTALAAESAQHQVPARLFNAAVSLQRLPEPDAAGSLRARMLLYALGMRWSLNLGEDLQDALFRLDGLDCGAGFLRALGQYQEEGHIQQEQWTSVLGLASALAKVPRLLPRDSPALAAPLRNLADSAERVRLPGAASVTTVDMRELTDATEAAINALRPSGHSPQLQDLLLDTAAILRGAFEETLGQASFGLSDEVDSASELRSRPRDEFLAAYQPFTEPAESALGTWPPVAAGAASADEWQTIAYTMLRDPGSLVPALRQV